MTTCPRVAKLTGSSGWGGNSASPSPGTLLHPFFGPLETLQSWGLEGVKPRELEIGGGRALEGGASFCALFRTHSLSSPSIQWLKK